MLLMLPWLCSLSSSAADGTSTTTVVDDRAAITGSNPGSCTLSSSNSTAAFDDAISVLTHPSLPSLQSLTPPLNPSPPFSASFLCLSSIIHACSAPTAAALAASSSSLLLYSATESTLSVYNLSDLRTIDTLPAPYGAGATKSISLCPNGTSIFTAHQDGRIRVWNRSP
ncbi:uncharacterized protein LOC110034562, partial [Phalaenopsis equestris]|uniref:uncharacterized protein LOC110034562 n=1 Tax=Phalaenopsis equestris TaxID=78828 RepID=UPI0009E3C4C8